MNDLLAEKQMSYAEPHFRQAIGLLADFTVDGASDPKRGPNAHFEWVAPEALLDFLRERGARLDIKVPITLSADDALYSLSLRFSNPGDFGESNIIAEFPALQRLGRCRQMTEKYLATGVFRDAAQWILASPGLTLAATAASDAPTRFMVFDEDFKRFFESRLTDSEKAIWILAKDMLASVASIEEFFEAVSLCGRDLQRDGLVDSDRLRKCDTVMEAVKRIITQKINEQVRAVEMTPQLVALRERWKGLGYLLRDHDVAILDSDPFELTRGTRISRWKCWSTLGVESGSTRIRWCDQVANRPRPLRCLIVDADLGNNSSWKAPELLRRCADLGRELQIPLVVSMQSDLFERWRGATEPRGHDGTGECSELEAKGRDTDLWGGERARFLVAARCHKSLPTSRREKELEAGAEPIADVDNIGYAESLSLIFRDLRVSGVLSQASLLPDAANIPYLAVSPAWREKTNLAEPEALSFLFWLSQVSCLFRRAAIQTATQDIQKLEGVLRALLRVDLLPSLQTRDSPFAAECPEIVLARSEWDAKRFQCKLVFDNCSFEHVFTVHRQTWLP
jgi:hypothetical protein